MHQRYPRHASPRSPLSRTIVAASSPRHCRENMHHHTTQHRMHAVRTSFVTRTSPHHASPRHASCIMPHLVTGSSPPAMSRIIAVIAAFDIFRASSSSPHNCRATFAASSPHPASTSHARRTPHARHLRACMPHAACTLARHTPHAHPHACRMPYHRHHRRRDITSQYYKPSPYRAAMISKRLQKRRHITASRIFAASRCTSPTPSSCIIAIAAIANKAEPVSSRIAAISALWTAQRTSST